MTTDRFLAIRGPATEDHTVDSATLQVVLREYKLLLENMAAAAKFRTCGISELTGPEKIALTNLRFGAPKAGSFCLPVKLAPLAISFMGTTVNISQNDVLTQADNFLTAITRSDEKTMNDLVPDPALRRTALTHVKKLIAPEKAGWYLEVEREGKSKITLTSTLSSAIDEQLENISSQASQAEFFFQIVAFSFNDGGRITFKSPLTGRDISATYSIEREEELLAHRRGAIRVKGNFLLDSEGQPIKNLGSVEISVEKLEPFSLRELLAADTHLRVKSDLEFKPSIDFESNSLVLNQPDMGLCVFGESEEMLKSELRSELSFLWKEYAKCKDDDLTFDAIQLKRKLLQHLEEISA